MSLIAVVVAAAAVFAGPQHSPARAARPVAAVQSAIVWPAAYLPGATDNFASNEIIVAGLTAQQVWPELVDTSAWPTYYSNASDIAFRDGTGPRLSLGARFFFRTFGAAVEAEVTEFQPPAGGRPGRVAWHGWSGEGPDTRMDIHHAWLIETLPGGRVRILTQESQKGQPAKALAAAVPNPMINGHQEWITGLARSALAKARR